MILGTSRYAPRQHFSFLHLDIFLSVQWLTLPLVHTVL
jgi:hypothetical protein